jgi:hypothetical protein
MILEFLLILLIMEKITHFLRLDTIKKIVLPPDFISDFYYLFIYVIIYLFLSGNSSLFFSYRL